MVLANFDLVRLGWLARALLATMLVSGVAMASERPTPEYQIKASYLYHFTKFVRWPAERQVGEPGIFYVCIIGEDPFGAAMDAFRAMRVGESRIRVLRPGIAGDFTPCHIAFVNSGRKRTDREILAQIRHHDLGVVTVTDNESMLNHHAMIAFRVVNDRVRFILNSDEAEKQGIQFAAKLHSVALASD